MWCLSFQSHAKGLQVQRLFMHNCGSNSHLKKVTKKSKNNGENKKFKKKILLINNIDTDIYR